MKKILDYISKNSLPILLGIGIGLVVAFICFFMSWEIIYKLWK